MQKRRERPRLKFGIIVKDKHHRQGETRDISVDGCFIEKKGGFAQLLPIGSHIELILDFPNAPHKIKVKGVVKHHGTHADGLGVYFESVDEHSVSIIEEFIQAFLDDALGEESARIKEEYWGEVDRLKEKKPHHDEQL